MLIFNLFYTIDKFSAIYYNVKKLIYSVEVNAMYIKSIGIDFRHNGDFLKDCPCGTDEYILLLNKSKAVFRLNKNQIYVNPDSVIVYKKGSPQHFRADGDIFINDWLCFDTDGNEMPFFENLGIKFDTIYELSDTAYISSLLKELFREHLNNSVFSKNITDCYLKLAFYKLAECINTSPRKPCAYAAELHKIRNEIYLSPCERYSIDAFAKKLNLSVSYFHHLYKAMFDTSPTAEMINSRIEYAKHLLVSTDYTVAEISEHLGYGSDVQFIRRFKSATQQTPLKYRRTFGTSSPTPFPPH